MEFFRLDQQQELAIVTKQIGSLQLRYSYARARETQLDNENGQDYLTYKGTSNEFVFCVCDGVSLSYYGNLAAQYLGDTLLEYMLSADSFNSTDTNLLQQQLHHYMQELTGPATQYVSQHHLPSSVTGILREVLEEKRELGSESMFVCGKLRFNEMGEVEQVLLAWLGDTRVRIWNEGSERSDRLQGSFSTQNRWSTVRGNIGHAPYVYSAVMSNPDQRVTRVQVYTDGMSDLDNRNDSLNDQELMGLMDSEKKKATSDDITFLELSWEHGKLTTTFAPRGRTQKQANRRFSFLTRFWRKH